MHHASNIKDSGLYIFMYALAKNKYIPIIKVRNLTDNRIIQLGELDGCGHYIDLL